MSTTTADKRYSFDEKKHIHTLDGKPLTGVTTVLSVVSKPFLYKWYADMAVDHIISNIVVRGDESSIVRTAAFEEARKAGFNKRDAAGDWGKTIHKWVENYVMAKIMNQTSVLPKPLDGLLGKACLHFIDWERKNNVTFLDSERNLYSESFWIGGICDLVVSIDGKKWICDVKTSSGIYPEHFWQMAAYDMCLQEMKLHSDIEGYIVINLKKSGEFDERRSISNDEHKRAFAACLDIYRIREKVSNQIIT